VKVFGIDPGSVRTGYGCIETDGRRHTLIDCGAIIPEAGAALADRLEDIHSRLGALIARHRPDCVAIENLFHAKNVKSALVLGHARGVAVLAAVQAGLPIVEYTPTAVKSSVVGHGRADKNQIQQMVKLLLGLPSVPTPHDAADALAIAICHVHSSGVAVQPAAATRVPRHLRSWRHAKLDSLGRRIS
jgi:crossover junction endodeoxyribonuclease RuvC